MSLRPPQDPPPSLYIPSFVREAYMPFFVRAHIVRKPENPLPAGGGRGGIYALLRTQPAPWVSLRIVHPAMIAEATQLRHLAIFPWARVHATTPSPYEYSCSGFATTRHPGAGGLPATPPPKMLCVGYIALPSELPVVVPSHT